MNTKLDMKAANVTWEEVNINLCDMTSSVRITSSRGERSPGLTTIRHDITVLETNVAGSKAEMLGEFLCSTFTEEDRTSDDCEAI